MPYASDAQRKYLHANEPEVAAKWDAEMKSDKSKDQRLSKQSAYAKAMRPGSQSPMGKKKTSASGAVGGASS
jgi:hypothetical protein